MKKINFLLIACLATCAIFTGCSDDPEEEIPTRPLVKFTDDIKETRESTYMVSVSVTSDQDLKEVKIEKIFPAKDESDEVIETVTTFTDPKRYAFEREFTAPATVEKMQIVFNAVTIRGLSANATFTFNTERSAFSQSAIVNALADAYVVFEMTGELPDEITVNNVVFNKAAYYEAACKVLLNILQGSDASITLSDYTLPGSPGSDTFVETEIPIELLENQSTRQLNFANANDGVFANYVGYPQNFVGPNGETYNGQFSFNRSVVVLARALAYYKTNGSLPVTLSSLYQVESETNFQEQFIDAFASAYMQFEISGSFPSTITVNNTVLNSGNYFEAACRILINIYNNTNTEITLSGYTAAGNPSADSFEEPEIPIELLINQATRQLNFAPGNDNIFANYVSYPQNFVGPNGETYNGYFSFDRGVVVMARALAYYKASSSLPATLSSLYQVEISQRPIAVWMWGSVLSNEDIQTIVNKLVENKVKKTYLLVKGTAGTRTPADKLTDFITKAHAEGIEVHLWFMINEDGVYMAANPNAGIYHCPKPSVSTDPYPMNDNSVNLLYPGYKEYVLDHIAYFLTNFDCDGIHLDAIRFGHFVYSFDQYSLQRAVSLGCNTTRLLSFFDTEPNYTTYATNNGFVNLYINEDQDVVKWVNMRKDVILDYIEAVKETIEQLKPGLKLSAAFMPEGATDPKYADVFYAQNYALHSTVLDMISPMAYFKAYGKPTSWLQTITQGAKNLVDPQCEIYSGVQGYDGVTASQMNEQIQYSFSGGAQGIIVFRYGTITEDSWEIIKEWGK